LVGAGVSAPSDPEIASGSGYRLLAQTITFAFCRRWKSTLSREWEP
jgi:hypothetical protein